MKLVFISPSFKEVSQLLQNKIQYFYTDLAKALNDILYWKNLLKDFF